MPVDLDGLAPGVLLLQRNAPVEIEFLACRQYFETATVDYDRLGKTPLALERSAPEEIDLATVGHRRDGLGEDGIGLVVILQIDVITR